MCTLLCAAQMDSADISVLAAAEDLLSPVKPAGQVLTQLVGQAKDLLRALERRQTVLHGAAHHSSRQLSELSRLLSACQQVSDDGFRG